MVLIRHARPADGAAIAALRAESWQAAYAGIIRADVLAGWTGKQIITQTAESITAERWQIMIVAETAGQRAGGEAEIVGFAASGPERAKGGMPAGGGPGQAARIELYAIYVAPAHWSSGTGRALLAEELEQARSAGFERMSLWVLDENSRARRFYEGAGFAATGDRLVTTELGGAVQVRYERAVS